MVIHIPQERVVEFFTFKSVSMTKEKIHPEVTCPICDTVFIKDRSNKKYCSRKCQVNSSRGPRTVEECPSQRRYQETFEGSYSELSRNFYDTPPQFRVEYMERLLQEGRRLVSVKRILTRKAVFWSYGNRGMLPIQQVFYHYCKEVYGMTVREVLDKANPLPSDAYYPCEYYGPDKEPTYSDGTYLKRSEQPFVARRGKIAEKLSTGKPYDWAEVAFKLSTNQEKKSAKYISDPNLKMLLRNWNDTTEEDELEKLTEVKLAA